MTFEQIDAVFQEASKVLHMDGSHDSIRQRIQASISAQHRKDNANSDSASYYNTPYVRDVFGDEDSGQVVHSKDGKMTLSKYKKQADGSYATGNHRSVKVAYVVTNDNDGDEKKESYLLLIGGEEKLVTEAGSFHKFDTHSEVIELQEADSKSGVAKVTLISAGKGSSGYYTEAALKKAADNKVFAKGTQMFLNHQTKEERAARPEGDITKLAAVTTSDATYIAGENGKPGRLVADTKIYPEYKDFISARKDDIGVSIRVGAEPSGQTKDGVPLVENMVYALSADFVTRAGRGGKIEELYESYRAEHPLKRQPAAEDESMTADEQKQFTTLQESVTAANVRMDRLMEQNTKLRAQNLAQESLTASGLSPRGQKRVMDQVLLNLPLTSDKDLDVTKFQESLKTAITDEKAYLQESGVQVRTVVRGQGGAVAMFKDNGEQKSDAEVVQEADKILEESIGALVGKATK